MFKQDDVEFEVDFREQEDTTIAAHGWLISGGNQITYFVARPCAGGFRCWYLGVNQLSLDEYSCASPASSAWLALPAHLRDGLSVKPSSDPSGSC